ncbi:MAG TPA: alkaline phosphatase family protein [Gemmatimonadales bacterium]|nr:alkaline phosphatase family protein [Gemmatimonadales bacterium]
MSRRSHLLLVLASAACAPASAPAPAPVGAQTPSSGRAILASFDALNEERVLATLPPASVPAFLELLREASCTDGARPMWPSVTAASHAAIWTGAYGDVNGVVANSQAPIPWSEFSLTDLRSGFESRELRAEPVWITAARAGRTAAAHHATQVGEPGRWRPEGGRDTAAVRRDSIALRDPRLFVLNGYSGGTGPRLLTAERNPARLATEWKNLDKLGPMNVLPREVSWAIAGDSIHALFFGTDAYREVLVSTLRDADRGVRVKPAPVERDPLEARELARYFSDPFWMGSPEGTGGMYFRLWHLAPDLSSYELLQTGRSVIRTNQPELLSRYQDAVGAFVGGPVREVLDAAPTLAEGGDGTPELKFLETAELETRQFIRGSEWIWRHHRPDFQAEYFSLGDGLDHLWFGLVSPGVPGHDPALAARIGAMRSRGWAMVDRRLAALRELARESRALLVVTGDHGMRPVWQHFHVNSALRRAGLLAVDARGRPDLTRTLAVANGTFVNVNRVGRKGGIVPPERIGAVIDSVERVLLAARAPDGSAIVTHTWRPEPNDTLGIGGPNGGDLYFDLARGFYYSPRIGDSLVTPRAPDGAHGFPSIDRDMRSALCAIGPGVGGRRLPTARVIDAAPTVSDWLGIPPPMEARGVSLLPRMRSTPGLRP